MFWSSSRAQEVYLWKQWRHTYCKSSLWQFFSCSLEFSIPVWFLLPLLGISRSALFLLNPVLQLPLPGSQPRSFLLFLSILWLVVDLGAVTEAMWLINSMHRNSDKMWTVYLLGWGIERPATGLPSCVWVVTGFCVTDARLRLLLSVPSLVLMRKQALFSPLLLASPHFALTTGEIWEQFLEYRTGATSSLALSE